MLTWGRPASWTGCSSLSSRVQDRGLARHCPALSARCWVGTQEWGQRNHANAGLESNCQQLLGETDCISVPCLTSKQTNTRPDVVNTDSLSLRFTLEEFQAFPLQHLSTVNPWAWTAELLFTPQSPAERPPPPRGPSGSPRALCAGSPAILETDHPLPDMAAFSGVCLRDTWPWWRRPEGTKGRAFSCLLPSKDPPLLSWRLADASDIWSDEVPEAGCVGLCPPQAHCLNLVQKTGTVM